MENVVINNRENSSSWTRHADVAIVIPCYNEQQTISKVVADFAHALPGARLIVVDNASTDQTALKAQEAGAEVLYSPKRGKGNAVRHVFESVDTEIFLLVDGDSTYSATAATELIQELRKGQADIVVGARVTKEDVAFRRFHRFGNRLVSILISKLFSVQLSDVMSGYRAISRAYAKTVPLRSNGFEIETEMTLQAATKDFEIREIPIAYGARPQGSYSKLDTYSDGLLVLKLIFLIVKDYKPFLFFSVLAAMLAMISITAGIFPILDYIRTGYVYRVPLAVLATGTGILSALSFSIGLILDTISKYQNENFHLFRRLGKK